MWTPRRVLLLLAGTVLFAAVYGVYALALGWIDGLPQLPSKMLARGTGEFRPPDRPVLPTIQLLREAFGPGCSEENTTTYANQFTFKSGESWVVVATGRVPNPDGGKSVTLSPFSVAVFGKPRPPHLRAPGEVAEVSTFHSDKAVLEFDRPVSGFADMSKAKLLRLELASDPEATTEDKRRGFVHITNNQRSDDRNKSLVMRTPGPLFYRDPKNADRRAAGPDVWTDAAIEIVDRQNLPRGYGAPAPETATTRAKDLQEAGVVPDILAGRRYPPPTVTAVGLKVYLDDPAAKAAAEKKGSAGFSGVRRLELGEKVLLNLWVDASQSVMAAPGAGGGGPGTSPLGVRDEPPAAAAVLGGLFTAAQSIKRLDRALLQVETLGPFAYDAERNVGRFDVVPQAEPSVQDYVQVHKLPPRGGTQRLFSQVLEIEFNGPLAGGKEPEPKAAAGAPGAGPSFKELRAWTYTPGRLVMVSSDADRLNAFGTELVHDQGKSRTVLKGSPVTAIRGNEPRADKKEAGESVLTAGAAGRPATLTMTTTTTTGAAGPKRATSSLIEGAGTMKLFDPNSGTQSVEAAWGTSMSHTREAAQGRELDLLTFTGAASFDDRKADFWLKGNVLKLWLDPAGQSGGQALPHQVQALGDVTSHSPDYDIERSDHLNVVFTEGTPARPTPRAVAAAPAAPAATATPPPGGAPAVASAPETKEEPKPKPPIRLRARLINTTVERVATKNDFAGLDLPGSKMPGLSPADPASRPVTGGTKYQLKQANCEGAEQVNGRLVPLVHQDPADPTKQPRGLDIYGNSLHLDQTPDGGVMTVTGEAGRPGQVHHEGMSVVGPKVVIDQLRNKLLVEGGGSLAMPAGSTLSGGEPQKATPPKTGEPQKAATPKSNVPPPPIVVFWRDSMLFEGALKSAEFIGRVRATQGESSIACHTMQVFFDKPVAFNPGRPSTGSASKNDAKIERVHCYAAPGDSPDEPSNANEVHYTDVTRDPAGRVLKWQFLKSAALEMTAKAADAVGQEPYQLVTAVGPGEVRIWQYGEKDVARTKTAPPPKDAARPAAAEGEMKLTVVKFTGRMVAKDKGRLYQEAVFLPEQNGGAPIEVVHAPASEPGADIPRANPPVGTVTLRCADRLVVSTHRPDGVPAAQRMDAYGNVFIRSDEYDGWGEIVNSDGRYVTLSAAGNALARIQHRFNPSGNTARRIVYDRATGDYRVTESAGATIQPSR